MSLYICCVLLAATTCGIVGIVNSNMVTKKDMGDILQGTSREYAQEIDITLAEIETAVNSLASITEETIGDVNYSVKELTACMSGIMEFLEASVLKDYKGFRSVGENYMQDAIEYEEGMSQINEAITELVSAIDEMSISVHGIADHTSNMMDKIKDNDSYISGSTRSVSNLENIVKEFSL